MSISENELLGTIDRDRIVQAAAQKLQQCRGVGGMQELRARRAFLLIGALMIENAAEVETTDFKAYLNEQYQLGTDGENIPFNIPTAPDLWRRITRTAFMAFEPYKRGWKPDIAEFAEAILNQDKRVKFSP